MPKQRTGTVQWWDGRWHARVTLADGNREWMDCSAHLTEKQRQLAKVEARRYTEWAKATGADRPTLEQARDGSAETLDQYAERWHRARELRGNKTVRSDRSRLRTHVSPLLGDVPMTAPAAVVTKRIEA
ncbi:MAG: hypothetical protein WCJ30_09790, partial [Deltaproteobacteria bacterium]